MTGGTLFNTANASRSFAGVSIDSRTIKTGQLFVAIRGENNDGHDYIKAALDRGAVGIISDVNYAGIDRIHSDIAVVAVPDTHQAMLAMARNYRDSIHTRFVGITGSNGKTTTREFTYQLLRAVTENVYRSPGNLNNLYGVPLAMFAIPQSSETAVMELGISTKKEMPVLASIVRPDVIVITNVGPTHLEFLESVEEVARAKLELVRAVSEDVPVILNADDKILIREALKVRTNFTTFAVEGDADFRPDAVTEETAGVNLTKIDGHSFRLPLPGTHQVYNLLAAYAAFKTLGYSLEGVNTLEIPFETTPMRGQMISRSGFTFMIDCYNANPESVRAGLAAFSGLPAEGRRVLVLGDMLELGTKAGFYHREVGRMLTEYEFDLALLVGTLSKDIMNEAVRLGIPQEKFRYYDNAVVCAQEISNYLVKGDFVFVKASRSVGLEAVINAVLGIEGDA